MTGLKNLVPAEAVRQQNAGTRHMQAPGRVRAHGMGNVKRAAQWSDLSGVCWYRERERRRWAAEWEAQVEGGVGDGGAVQEMVLQQELPCDLSPSPSPPPRLNSRLLDPLLEDDSLTRHRTYTRLCVPIL